MIFPEKMVYLRIEIPEESFEKELINIGKSRLLHIDGRKGQKLFLEEEKRAEYLYALTEKFLDILEIKEKTTGYKEFQIEEVEQFLSEIQSEINSISNLDKEIKKDEELLRQAEKIKMRTSEKLNIPYLIKNLKHIKLKTGLFPSENIEPLILSLKSYDVFYLSGMVSEGTGWIVVFFVEEESLVRNILEKNQVKEIPLQCFTEEFVKGLEKKKKSPDEAKEKYERKIYSKAFADQQLFKKENISYQSEKICRETRPLLFSVGLGTRKKIKRVCGIFRILISADISCKRGCTCFAENSLYI